MIIRTYGPTIEQVNDILSSYDMRTGRREIHREMYPGMLEVFTYCIDGEKSPVSSLNPAGVWQWFIAGLDAEGIGAIQIVSRDNRQRVKRQGKRVYIHESRRYDLGEIMEACPDRALLISSIETVRRERREREWLAFEKVEDRTAETVSEYLPDFKVYLRDVLPGIMEVRENHQRTEKPAFIDRGNNRGSYGRAIPGMAF